jgi:hypothetical protein
MNSPAPSRPFGLLELRDLLAPALGDEKSHELITTCASRHGIALATLTYEGAARILSELAKEGGIVGVAARLAHARLPMALTRAQAEPAPTSGLRQSGAHSTNIRPMIEQTLSATLGAEKSAEVVAEAIASLGFPRYLDAEQGARVLDLLSRAPGMVGVVARFARSRYDK